MKAQTRGYSDTHGLHIGNRHIFELPPAILHHRHTDNIITTIHQPLQYSL